MAAPGRPTGDGHVPVHGHRGLDAARRRRSAPPPGGRSSSAIASSSAAALAAERRRRGQAPRATRSSSSSRARPPPSRAVADAQRALAAEPWPDGAAVRVRMGLHTGDRRAGRGRRLRRPRRPPGGARRGGRPRRPGAAVRGDRGARRRRACRPGVDAAAARRAPPQGPAARSGSPSSSSTGCRRDFPPIRSLDARPNNLPMELTTFVGRERELAETRALLATLAARDAHGPGRHRQDAARAPGRGRRWPTSSPTGPGSCRSAPSPTRTSSIPAIARRDRASATTRRGRPLDVLGAELASKQRPARARQPRAGARRRPPTSASCSARAGKVRILATSRAPLRISGEQEYPVPGLPSPVDLDRLGPYERERLPAGDPVRDAGGARRVRVGPAVRRPRRRRQAGVRAHRRQRRATSRRSSPTSAACPLAIELAAARLRFLTPAAIHERLEGRLDLPGAGAADVPERQRSLRGAIMWSHELLDPPARRLFERLGRVHRAASTSRGPRRSPARRRDLGDRRARRARVARRPEPRAQRRGRRASRGSRCSSRSASTRSSASRPSGDADAVARAPRPRATSSSRASSSPSSPATASAPRSTGSSWSTRTCGRRSTGRTPAATPRSPSGSRSPSGGSGRSAATCARRGRASRR